MVSRLFLLYAVVELLVVVGLASTIGLGWTLLAVLVAFAAGLAVAGSQLKLQLSRLRSGINTDQSRLASDSALIALGSLLVVVPGLVTSAAGLLLLLPPSRAAARPMLTALAARGVGRFPLITVATVGADRYARRAQPDYIDGEVLDVNDVTDVTDVPVVKPPALPLRPE
jgi:UPF0716 protein FxsA